MLRVMGLMLARVLGIDNGFYQLQKLPELLKNTNYVSYN